MADLPDWVPVQSSNIEAARYDNETGTLSIRFRNGSEYSYGSVPEEIAQALLHADSPGRFLHYEIRGKYEIV